MIPDDPEPAPTPTGPIFSPPGHDLQMGRRYARWAFWGCAGLLLAALLLTLGFLLVLMSRPEGKNLLKASEHVAVCREHLINVSGALDRYHRDKGVAPVRLEALYPTYLSDNAELHCPADGGEGATSYVYRPSISWGSGTDIVVYCPHHLVPKISGLSEQDRPYVLLFIRQNGDVSRQSATRSQIDALAPTSRAER